METGAFMVPSQAVVNGRGTRTEAGRHQAFAFASNEQSTSERTQAGWDGSQGAKRHIDPIRPFPFLPTRNIPFKFGIPFHCCQHEAPQDWFCRCRDGGALRTPHSHHYHILDTFPCLFHLLGLVPRSFSVWACTEAV
jgi:hypothetical protein